VRGVSHFTLDDRTSLGRLAVTSASSPSRPPHGVREHRAGRNVLPLDHPLVEQLERRQLPRFLRAGAVTPVFVRFSTVLGSRGSADTVRDTRGFATKLYTEEGTFDLVGNNIPVFFIQDAIKFPDVIHAGKPHPDREISQAQSAHDTFWDFVTLHTEATAHTLWNMSDQAIPRSYRMMEGFGIHRFRLSNEQGETVLVKFHWKPALGVHSLVWEEAQLLVGMDPDFHRRDLADAIESGAHPRWELGVQVFPDSPDQTFAGIDLLDPTKFVPEELAEVRPIGTMTLTANPTNYFAETEQVAFHPGHLVPGIDVTDDPLLQGRLFSYLDTQISRLGGPNFGQLPINHPHAPVNDLNRDGMHQGAVHHGVAPYKPNSLDAGCPFVAGAETAAFIEAPSTVPRSRKTREAPESFNDHFSQARLFWTSLTELERAHVVQAYTFELGKCYETSIRQRALHVLTRIDPELCERVADALGLPVPDVEGQPDGEVETSSPDLDVGDGVAAIRDGHRHVGEHASGRVLPRTGIRVRQRLAHRVHQAGVLGKFPQHADPRMRHDTRAIRADPDPP
jgi:catalase